jgi:hypothetical protein
MKPELLWLTILFAFALRPADCRAQGDGIEELQTFIASDFHKGLVAKALSTIPPAVFQRCPALQSNGADVTILRPLSFGKGGRPNAGAWREAFPVAGCGNDTVLNIFFEAGKDKKINTMVGFPGTTHADLVLQGDAQLYASVGAGILAKDCETFDVKNTRFEAYGLSDPPTADPGPDSRLRPWWETWTMTGCGRTIDVQLDFAPDETGTQITQPDGGRKER